MWAGIAANLDQYLGRPLGALNPYLYSIYQDKAVYGKAFNQVTSGYNGAYQAGPGYNLVTGLGSPDVPHLASALVNLVGGLSVKVGTSLSPLGTFPQYAYGNAFTIATTVKNTVGITVSTGAFTAEVDSVSGLVVIVPLSFNGSKWVGSCHVQSGSPPGTWSITVSGSSGGATGQGSTDIEVGTSMALVNPVPYPFSAPIPPDQAFPIDVALSYPNGTAISGAVLSAHFLQGGKDIFDIPLTSMGVGAYFAEPMLAAGMPQGTYTLVVNGTGLGSVFEYVYFGEALIGVMLSPTDDAITSVSPGQLVTFLASPSTAESAGKFTSNVTASIYELDGTLVASVQLQPAPNSVQFGVFNFFYYQQANFTIPAYLKAGFYRLGFTSSYDANATTGLQLGSFSTGFYVSGPTSSYSLIGPSVAFEGEYLNVTAKITDSAGHSVHTGVFNLNVLPTQLSYASAYYGSLLLSGVPMQYNKSLGEWTSSYQIPSILTEPFYYSNDLAVLAGSWTFFVSGESSSAESVAAQYSYTNVLPYTLLGYHQLNSSTVGRASLVTFNGSGYALDNAGATSLTVNGLTLRLGEDSISNLTIVNSTVDIIGSKVLTLKAVDSTVGLLSNTGVGSLSLTGSIVAVRDSTYQTISPALPSISVSGLSQPVSGLANFTITVAGNQLRTDSLMATIDGVKVPLSVTPTTGGLSATATLNASSLNDGIHSLSVTASQADGLSASFSTFFSTNAQSAVLRNQLGILQGTLQSLNGTVSSLNTRLKSTSAEVVNLTYLAYGLVVAVILSLVFAVYAVRRKSAALAVASAA
jgi:subtilase family serine protease